jgi:two-component system invasion response regulator UvrY
VLFQALREEGFELLLAQSGEEAITTARQVRPQLILLDINMPGIGGLDAMQRILRINDDIKIIMLTMHTENPFPSKVMQAGAVGYLSKAAAPDEVLNAIRLVNSGQRYLAPEIAQQMALSQISPITEDPFSILSERELQIMIMITKGLRVVDISEQLDLNPKTINSYRYRLFSKLGVNGDVGLTHLAIRYGMLDADML